MKNTCIALLVLFSFAVGAQNIGIGTSTPKARLHVADSAVAFTGPAALPANAGLPPVSGPGIRMMWYPNKAAFRAGQVTGGQWNENSVGLHSVAFGYNTRAIGQYSAAFGNSTSATGKGAFAMGNGSSATGEYSVALGEATIANKSNSLVIGQYNETQGSHPYWGNEYAFVIGGGYVDDLGGVGSIVRKNVFTVSKSGTTIMEGNAYVKHALTVESLSILKDTVFISKPVGIGLSGGPKTSLDINGALALRESYQTIQYTGSVIPVTVGNRGFIGIAGDNPVPVIKLSSGSVAGQVLILTCTNTGYFKLVDNVLTSNVNVNGDRTLHQDDVLVLVYNGNWWMEVSFTNN